MNIIKVLFLGKIKNLSEEYRKYNQDLYESAKKIPGFIGMESEEIDDIEITISKWKSKDDVICWAKNSLHVEAKRKVNNWYYWYKSIQFECLEP
jgi:heme-degrading monooxygenase HmoA